MFGNPYVNSYNPQDNIERINAQIMQLENMKKHIQQPPVQQQPTNLTQNFQIAPTNRETMKYTSSIDEVQKEVVTCETPYFSKDMSIVWIKDAKGDIKTYELTEIISKDEKDMKIEFLMAQIQELKKEMKKNESNAIINEPSEDEKSSNVSTISKSTKKSK